MEPKDIQEELTICDTIDIRRTGYCQAHGLLIAFESVKLEKVAHSRNLSDFLSGRDLNEFLEIIRAKIPNFLPIQSVDCVPIPLIYGNQEFYLTFHSRSGAVILAEIEPKQDGIYTDQLLHNYVVDVQAKISKAGTLPELVNVTLDTIQRMTDFDRVMVYKFHRDQHGEVIGESKAEELDSFLGLHYPASDIPKLAREMYVLNRIRQICNVNASPVPIESETDLDLTGAFMRSVAPVHLHYLRNMGVNSSFSISLVVNNKLWGLIACHHNSPSYFTPRLRSTLDFIGRMISVAVERIEVETQRVLYQKNISITNNLFSNALLQEDPKYFFHGKNTLLDVIPADVCFLLEEGKIVATSCDENLSEMRIAAESLLKDIKKTRDIVKSAKANFGQNICFKGFLFIPLSTEFGDALVFLRKEFREEIKWAGAEVGERRNLNPQDPRRLEPRGSFDLWTEESKDQCREWSEENEEQASHLQTLFTTHWIGLLKRKNRIQEKQLLEIKNLSIRLEHVSEMKTIFLANMSHEIRTPINAISGIVSLLSADNNEQRELLATMKMSINHLLSVVNNILDISKIEAGMIEFENNELSIRSLLNDTVKTFSSLSRKKGISLYNIVNHEVPKIILGDGTYLRQIFYNLINNAIKFTKNGSIVVKANKKKMSSNSILIRFEVIDSGIGIKKEKIETIFESFAQADSSTKRKYGGTGLGLTICKQLVHLMNGKIGVESEVGLGSTFWFEMEFDFVEKELSPRKDFKEIKPLLLLEQPITRQFFSEMLTARGFSLPEFGLSSELVKNPAIAGKYNIVISDSAKTIPLLKNISKTKNSFLISYEQGSLEDDGDVIQFLPPFCYDKILSFICDSLENKSGIELNPKTEEYSCSIADKAEILLVEDDLTSQLITKKILTKLGFRVSVARNGQEAVDISASKSFSLILMDCHMPKLDGFEATRIIRNQKNGANPKIIALTADALVGSERDCLKAGMDDYLSKPITLESLREKLLNYIA